ncbi:MAG: transposase [Calditrichia bacterium]|nr:transposase [Calditrichia bacterium]
MKVKRTSINRKKISWLLEQDLDVKITALQHHLDISRMLVNDILEDEVKNYTGDWYSHDKPHDGRYSRWGSNPGSIKLGERRIKLEVPRIYDNESDCNKPLDSYGKLREMDSLDDRILKAVLLGLSTRDYKQVIGNLLDGFGLSSSSVSNEFIEQSSQKLEAFENRDLSDYDFVSLFIDGKYLAKEQIIIVLGVTIQGDKIAIGFVQSHSENATVIRDLLNNLIERGLRYEEGLLCVIDGSKGIYKAIKEIFNGYAVIHRCHWHKRKNVLEYLNENKQDHYRKRINQAYRTDDYDEARNLIYKIITDLRTDNLSASRSMEEGLEETLTLHRLGLIEDFRQSFVTTNCIENLNSQIEKYLRKVKNWKTSSQRYRWVSSALLDIEHRMRKVNNYSKLSVMRAKIKQDLKIENKEVA